MSNPLLPEPVDPGPFAPKSLTLSAADIEWLEAKGRERGTSASEVARSVIRAARDYEQVERREAERRDGERRAEEDRREIDRRQVA